MKRKKIIDVGCLDSPETMDIDAFVAKVVEFKEKGATKVSIYGDRDGEITVDFYSEREETDEEEAERLSQPRRPIKLKYWPIQRTSE